MMNKKNILVVVAGNNDPQLSAWCTENELYQISFARSDEQAIEFAQQQYFDLVLMDSTNEELNQKKLRAVLPILIDDVLMASFDGETREQLDQKISYLFEKRKAERLQRLLVLDATAGNSTFAGLPPFSVN
jgi:signal recognition particle GTPase